ncbi:hypothetical protein LOTGIDRAFT_174755 [Lottia gigantea]|uniref:Apple domain-containing protein n=1 Tax=Lottia gigantea TaxID=225164 RepID=V3ZYP3_LOTGI|nr:hypothetical protein LOTGIDRAFT_174755 [Lottia gigantea]ESO96653.1 hypothetical protein LOTGIDRAFT_174755 [Lottia gigantea]
MTVISNLMLVIVLLCVVSLQVASSKPHSRIRKAVDGKKDCYKITEDKMADYQNWNLTSDKTEDECKQMCENNTQCITFLSNRYLIENDMTLYCVLFPEPHIFTAVDISLEECKKKCTEMKECKTLQYITDNCQLYDIEYSKIPADKLKHEPLMILAERTC